MSVFFGIVAFIVAVLLAIGLQTAKKGTQWLLIFMGQRVPIRICEGLVWWPRFFSKEVYNILEEEVVVLRDDQPDGRTHETIMTRNYVEVIVRNFSVFYSVARHDAAQPKSTFWKLARFLGWEPGYDLLAFSQLADANVSGEKNEVVRHNKLVERIREIALPELRKNVRLHRYEEVLGISLEDENVPTTDREEFNDATGDITDALQLSVQKSTRSSGVNVTLVLIGDIDPPQVVKDAMLAKAVAKGERAAALVRFNAIETIMTGLLKFANVTNPTLEQVTALYSEVRGKDSAEFAQTSPEPDASELWTDVLVD